jgi:hypothetical protein
MFMTKLQNRFVFFGLLAAPIGALIAAILAYTASQGELVWRVSQDWEIYVSSMHLGGLAALVGASSMFLSIPLYLRLVRIRREQKCNLAKEISISIFSAAIIGLSIILFWPKPIFKVYLYPSEGSGYIHRKFFGIRGMKGETYYGNMDPYWNLKTLLLTKEEKNTFQVSENLYSCGQIENGEFMIFRWGKDLIFDSLNWRPKSKEDLNKNCVPGIKDVELTQDQLLRLEDVYEDGIIWNGPELQVAKGDLNLDWVTDKARYLIFRHYPDKAKNFLVASGNITGNDVYNVEDHLLAISKCDVGYAQFLHQSELKIGAEHFYWLITNVLSMRVEEQVFVHSKESINIDCAHLTIFYIENTDYLSDPYIYQELVYQLNVELPPATRYLLEYLLKKTDAYYLLGYLHRFGNLELDELLQSIPPSEITYKYSKEQLSELYGLDWTFYKAWLKN